MAGGRSILGGAGCKATIVGPGGRAQRLGKVGAIASAGWFMLLRELSTRDRPFCGTASHHASDDELGALGLRRDVRSSPPGREQKAGQQQWVDAASPPRPRMGERTWR